MEAYAAFRSLGLPAQSEEGDAAVSTRPPTALCSPAALAAARLRPSESRWQSPMAAAVVAVEAACASSRAWASAARASAVQALVAPDRAREAAVRGGPVLGVRRRQTVRARPAWLAARVRSGSDRGRALPTPRRRHAAPRPERRLTRVRRSSSPCACAPAPLPWGGHQRVPAEKGAAISHCWFCNPVEKDAAPAGAAKNCLVGPCLRRTSNRTCGKAQNRFRFAWLDHLCRSQWPLCERVRSACGMCPMTLRGADVSISHVV